MQQSMGAAARPAALAEMGATKERIASAFHCLAGLYPRKGRQTTTR